MKKYLPRNWSDVGSMLFVLGTLIVATWPLAPRLIDLFR